MNQKFHRCETVGLIFFCLVWNATGVADQQPLFFCRVLAVFVSKSRFFGPHHAIQLVAGCPNHLLSSKKEQNCLQGIILKVGHTFSSRQKSRERFSPNPHRLVSPFFMQFNRYLTVWAETHGNVLFQKPLGAHFLLVSWMEISTSKKTQISTKFWMRGLQRISDQTRNQKFHRCETVGLLFFCLVWNATGVADQQPLFFCRVL